MLSVPNRSPHALCDGDGGLVDRRCRNRGKAQVFSQKRRRRILLHSYQPDVELDNVFAVWHRIQARPFPVGVKSEFLDGEAAQCREVAPFGESFALIWCP